MFSADIITRFTLQSQHQSSPDGFLIFVSANLSQNQPTVFFEYMPASGDEGNTASVRISKAGSIDSFSLTIPELQELSFEDMHRKVQQLHIPG